VVERQGALSSQIFSRTLPSIWTGWCVLQFEDTFQRPRRAVVGRVPWIPGGRIEQVITGCVDLRRNQIPDRRLSPADRMFSQAAI
jgi:hypothetical protein